MAPAPTVQPSATTSQTSTTSGVALGPAAHIPQQQPPSAVGATPGPTGQTLQQSQSPKSTTGSSLFGTQTQERPPPSTQLSAGAKSLISSSQAMMSPTAAKHRRTEKAMAAVMGGLGSHFPSIQGSDILTASQALSLAKSQMPPPASPAATKAQMREKKKEEAKRKEEEKEKEEAAKEVTTTEGEQSGKPKERPRVCGAGYVEPKDEYIRQYSKNREMKYIWLKTIAAGSEGTATMMKLVSGGTERMVGMAFCMKLYEGDHRRN
ncbi:hypothetical protein BGZ95_007634, partial [Linnemannia exigua]